VKGQNEGTEWSKGKVTIGKTGAEEKGLRYLKNWHDENNGWVLAGAD
jgi:hypothetical protein